MPSPMTLDDNKIWQTIHDYTDLLAFISNEPNCYMYLKTHCTFREKSGKSVKNLLILSIYLIHSCIIPFVYVAPVQMHN